MSDTKAPVVLQWHGEKAIPISRQEAARVIRGNRNRGDRKALRIEVQRKHGETYITSQFLGIGCCIHPA